MRARSLIAAIATSALCLVPVQPAGAATCSGSAILGCRFLGSYSGGGVNVPNGFEYLGSGTMVFQSRTDVPEVVPFAIHIEVTFDPPLVNAEQPPRTGSGPVTIGGEAFEETVSFQASFAGTAGNRYVYTAIDLASPVPGIPAGIAAIGTIDLNKASVGGMEIQGRGTITALKTG